MKKTINGIAVVDLDRPPSPGALEQSAAKPKRSRRQCEFCFTNRTSILNWERRDCETQALQG